MVNYSGSGIISGGEYFEEWNNCRRGYSRRRYSRRGYFKSGYLRSRGVSGAEEYLAQRSIWSSQVFAGGNRKRSYSVI
jgi:hypothetical protein